MTLITSFEPVGHTKREMSEEEVKGREKERDKVVNMVQDCRGFIRFLIRKYVYIDGCIIAEYDQLVQDKIDPSIALYVVLRDNEIYVRINDYVDYYYFGGRY